MGQNQSVPETNPQSDIVCEIFSQAVVHASQKLKDYLGFEDPFGSFRPGTDTLNELFLVNFINFCLEKGVEERIATNKMTQQQSALFGVDWIWTLSGSDKAVKLQIAVQAFQIAELDPKESGTQGKAPKEVQSPVGASKDKNRLEKLEEFCRLVGSDCLGLFMVYGLPGKPKDIRGVLLDCVKRDMRKNAALGEQVLYRYLQNTDTFLPTRDLLDTCMGRKNGQLGIGKVYINFL
ncbi:hypothetical protein XENTR_v10007561 [Xenopus tropicalis]|uniref:Rab15 effector protein n=1 Tax=Xenopus tropicalis TaxID=8364 RepID=A0A7D9NJL4_XENTR|nr:rab15 effector protein [Xenopus tropicalis]XP_031754315.1 rab15 effector protein [Xenopus tropicalis]XP_031754316.1 rab15 effector protein [Xenopus tropicalis]KAE8613087.1 hypothetical protein XENTR_v10007561 [Xenopus tropicalis]|eukprot:XP_017945904.1 PREDICTED: rab15 effector protein [Xenopus tropicalis]